MSQISLETTSKHTPQIVIEKAKQKFKSDLGLDLIEEAECCIRLEGGGGFIFIQAEPQDDHTKVTLEGQEWTNQLMNFMKEIAT